MKDEKKISRENVILDLQDILFEHPLYELMEPSVEDRVINILIYGDGEYALEFADLCLQMGQTDGLWTDINIYCPDSEKCLKKYIADRPDITRFVNINGAADGDESMYADLRILDIPSPEGEGALTGDMEDTALSILLEAIEKYQPYNYIFVDTCDDEADLKMASCFLSQTSGRKDRCPICYAQRGEDPACKDSAGESFADDERLIPVRGRQREKKKLSELREETDALTLRAFRLHLLWLGDGNADIEAEYERFIDNSYNYLSSRSSALSTGAKLYGSGIIMKKDCRFEDMGKLYVASDAEDAAAEFSGRVLEGSSKDPEKKEALGRIVASEHRRWVLSLVTEGWTAPRNRRGELLPERCVLEGAVRNEKKKTHPCLVKSTLAMPLEDPSYERDGRAKWEEPWDRSLDELDLLSIRLHQLMRARADKVIEEKPLESGPVMGIEDAISDMGRDVKLSFKEFKYCLSNILEANIPYTRRYFDARRDFAGRIEGFPKDETSDTEESGGKLTYEEEIGLYIAQNLKRIDEMFFPVREANLYRNYKANDLAIAENIPYILTWKFRPHLALFFEDGHLDAGRNDKVFSSVASATMLSPSSICYFYHFDRYCDADILGEKLSAVRNYLENRNASCSIRLVVSCDTHAAKRDIKKLRELIRDINDDDMPIYRGICADEFFICNDEYEAADYFEKKLRELNPDLFDGSTGAFRSRRACAYLYGKIKEAKVPYFELDQRRKRFEALDGCEYLKYSIDKSYLRIEDMFALMNAKITYDHFENESTFPDFPEELDALWDIYMGDYCAYRYEKSSAAWNALCNSISSSNCPGLSARSVPAGRSNGEVEALLKALQRGGFISGLGFSGGPNNTVKADFDFTSRKVRALFEKSGDILETHTYSEVLKTGYFDDAAVSYQFAWDDGRIKNELDLVLTKGFRSMLIECKAVSAISQDYYFKLQGIAQSFGIGSVMVLISQLKRDGTGNEALSRSRGNRMSIVTISDKSKIENIGETLKEIMERSM